MGKLFLKTFLLSFFTAHLLLAQNTYLVSKIPEAIRKNADAVVRFDETEFIIENASTTTTKRHWAVTIYSDEGEENYSTFMVNYDKYSKIKKIEGIIYDQNGGKLQELKKSDIKDIGYGALDDITDNRVKIASLTKKNFQYPYTVEFSYEKYSKNNMFFPVWTPYEYEKTAIENAKFIVKTAPGILFRRKIKNLNIPEITSQDGNFRVSSWEIKNYPPIEFEKFSLNENLPSITTAPLDFEFENYVGKQNSWKDIANFNASLNNGRGDLSENTISKLKVAIGNENNPSEKIRKTYEFMQNHTRYASIQLGIGGWQSMTANEVESKGFGDCKALTNYTVALLKSIGITAYPVLIKSESINADAVITDFPNMYFDHVIACVPMPKDTIWLECTSQDNPFGYLGSFTGNRVGLLIKPDGGKLINTIKYAPKDNSQKRTADIQILENGNGIVDLKTLYTGIQYENREETVKLSNEKQVESLSKKFNFPNIAVKTLKYELNKKKIPEILESANFEVQKLASVNGNRIFIKPNLFTKFIANPASTENRKTNLYLNPNQYTFEDTDKINFHVPPGYAVEYTSKDYSEKNIFGEYQTSIKDENGVLVFSRMVSIYGGKFPPSAYNDWVEFVKRVNKNDIQKIVLVKK